MKTEKAELPPKTFATQSAWAGWLEKNHAKSDGIWLKIFKKDSGRKSVTCAEVLEISLCYGWIDAQRRGLDKEAFLQRYTPRRKGSIWSKINRDKALLLIGENRMKPEGLKAIEEAKKSGRWENAYAPQRSATAPQDLLDALAPFPKALEFFNSLKGQNRYAFLFRIETCKKPETRQRRIQAFVKMLKEQKTFYPNKVRTPLT